MNAPRGTLQARLFWAFALITVIAVAVPALTSRHTLYQDRLDLAGRQALAQATVFRQLFATGLDPDQTTALLDGVRSIGMRLTIADPGGKVLHDSDLGSDRLEDLDNHNDRPEIEAARQSGSGVSLRHSNSLGLEAMYAAVRLEDGGILRIAVPLADIRRSVEEELSSLGLTIALVGCLCLLLSALIARRFRSGIDTMAEVVADIAKRRGGRRLLQVPGREFLPLAYAVNRMAENIEEYLVTTSDQQTQLEVILDSMHEGVLVLGPSGNIRRCNRAMEALFPGIGESGGKQLIEVIPVPGLQRGVDRIIHGQADKASGREGDEAIHFETENGRFLVAHLSRPVEANLSLGAVIVIYDATEIMRLEGIRRDFVANVSHELRTPLTAITGYAETLMHMEGDSAECRGFAGIIHKHAQALARVITDLLALARIENTREEIPLAPTDPAQPIGEAVRLCREQAERKQLTITLRLDEKQPVMANASLLSQVFRNLLENACRYSPQGGEIVISCGRAGRELLFSVLDHGPGIPHNDLERIFERLYQVKKQRNSGSSGIGLAISKHIIERHGGRIWAESPCEGFATAMRFVIPVA